MDMHCTWIHTRLGDYLDRGLPSHEREQVRTHLETCQGCSEALAMTRELLSGLAELDDAVLPVGFSQRLSARLHQEAERIEGLPKARRPSPKTGWWGALIPTSWPVRAMGGVAAGFAALALFFAGGPEAGLHPATPGTEMVAGTAAHRVVPVHVNLGGDAEMRVWFESDRAVDNVRFSVALPPGVRMVNGGKLVDVGILTWEGQLKKGRNLIPLQVRGVARGEWTVSASVEKGGSRREQSIGLRVNGV